MLFTKCWELRVLHNTVLKRNFDMVDKLDITELPKVTTKSELASELSKAIPMNWESAFCNKHLNISDIQKVATQIEAKGNYSTQLEFVQLLASELKGAPDMRKEGTKGESSTPRKSGKLQLTYTATGDPKPFDKQAQLNAIYRMKADAELAGLPFAYQSQLDKLEAEKKAFDKKYNSQLKLDKAKSSNIVDYLTKIGNLIDNAKKSGAKVSELAPALDMASECVVNPLKTGTQEDKDNAKKYEYAIGIYRKYVEAFKELDKAIDKLENPCTLDLGTETIDLNEEPQEGKEA